MARGAWGETGQVGSPPSRQWRLPPPSARGGAAAGPAYRPPSGAHAGTDPFALSVLGGAPVGPRALRAPSWQLQLDDASPHPPLLTFSMVASPSLWRFLEHRTFHPRLPSQPASISPLNPMFLFPCVSTSSLPSTSPTSPCMGLPVSVSFLFLPLSSMPCSSCLHLCSPSISLSDRSCPSFLLPPYLSPLSPSMLLPYPSFGVC